MVKMEAAEVSEIIEREIGGDWSLSNLHGVDLRRCLVKPTKKVYKDSFREGEKVELWLVLEEVPEDHSGYKIVFDERRRLFGLATKGLDGADVLIGYYGSFVDTLEAM